MLRLRIAVALWSSVIIAGCGGDRDAGEPAAKGVEISTAPRWTAEPVIRIGSVDDSEQALTAVGHAVIGPDTELYLSQPQEGLIRVFDDDGRLTRSIEHSGEGPGEFSYVSYIGLEGDTLYATDDGLRRVSFFSLDGQTVNTVSWHTEGRSGPRWKEKRAGLIYLGTVPQIFLPDGTALVEVAAGPFVAVSQARHDPIWSLGPWQSPFLHIDSRGEVIDTIAQVPNKFLRFGVDDGDATRYYNPPFLDGPLSAFMRDGSGVVLVDRTIAANEGNASFTVVLLGVSGDTVSSKVLRYEPVALTDEIVERSVRLLHTVRGPRPDPSAAVRVLRANNLIPPYLPPVTALSVGQDGSIWLRREDLAADSILWNVLDGNGKLRGAVRLPRGDSVIAARGDIMATVAYDELDVPHVVKYRLHR